MNKHFPYKQYVRMQLSKINTCIRKLIKMLKFLASASPLQLVNIVNIFYCELHIYEHVQLLFHWPIRTVDHTTILKKKKLTFAISKCIRKQNNPK